MGKGLGTVQRRVLEVLPVDYARRTIIEITSAIYGADSTESHRRGVSRAVSTLADRGLVRTSLTARRFRDVTVKRPEYRPSYFWPEDGKWYGGHMAERTDTYRVPVPELLVWLTPAGPAGESFAQAIAEDRRLSGGSDL